MPTKSLKTKNLAQGTTTDLCKIWKKKHLNEFVSQTSPFCETILRLTTKKLIKKQVPLRTTRQEG